jgi:TRAP transporter TAXI family solute receptor
MLQSWGAREQASTGMLASELEASLNGLHIELNQATAPRTALELLQRRQTDAVFTFAAFAYMASTGELNGATDFSDAVRAIAELPARPLQLVVRGDSTVRSIADLRGRRVSLGPIASGNVYLMGTLVLSAFGVAPETVAVSPLPFRDASRQLIAGKIDALFMSGYAYPEIAYVLSHGGRLLNIEGPEVDRLRAAYPLLHPTVLARGTYPSVEQAIHTVGIDEVFVCRTDLEEGIVHELTRAFVEVVSKGDLDIEALRFMDLAAASATAIPLHPGAARYYRERELLP